MIVRLKRPDGFCTPIKGIEQVPVVELIKGIEQVPLVEVPTVTKPEQSARNKGGEAEQGTSLLRRGFSNDGITGMDVVDQADTNDELIFTKEDGTTFPPVLLPIASKGYQTLADAVFLEDKKAVADPDAATTPSQAEHMKVLQSIWDASAVATASRGDLRFMPFSDPLSKLAELRTLEGHSDAVRCGVHCTFVMIWLRRRSFALPCFRMGGASCLGRATTRSRCGTWRPVNAWRR